MSYLARSGQSTHPSLSKGNEEGRRRILDLLRRFLSAWEAGDPSAIAACVVSSSSVRISTQSLLAQLTGAAQFLAKDGAAGRSITTHAVNVYAASNSEQGWLGAYLHGAVVLDKRRLQYGALISAQTVYQSHQEIFEDLAIQVLWTDGDASVVPHWQLPPARIWQQGDTSSLIVSELHSPWARAGTTYLPEDPNEQFEELFARYAWAMDQADFSLMKTCLTEDISGEFTPLGHLRGISEVVGTLKAFRQAWPWMQHFGRVLKWRLKDDGREADVIVGRIIPSMTHQPSGDPVYGAHYRLTVVFADDCWKIRNFAYIPGWIDGA